MELYQLIYFRVTAQTGNFTKAAEQLYITQPSLSRAISNLELELGTPLFDRTGKKIQLNEFGTLFLEKTNTILDNVDDAVYSVQRCLKGDFGQVRVGSTIKISEPSPLHYFQETFLKNHPSYALSLLNFDYEKISRLLEEKKLDFGVSLSPFNLPGIHSEVLYSDRLGVIVGPTHHLADKKSIRIESLAQETFFTNANAQEPHDSARHFCALAGFSPRILYEGPSAALVGDLVASGKGISFSSMSKFNYLQKRGRSVNQERPLIFIEIENEFCLRTIYLHHRPAESLPLAARLFREELFEMPGVETSAAEYSEGKELKDEKDTD